jgi:hypothetical protein
MSSEEDNRGENMSRRFDDLREYQHGGNHYTSKTVQPWDAMDAWMTEEQVKGFMLGNVIKYIARFQDKGGKVDLEKAKHYLDKCLELW